MSKNADALIFATARTDGAKVPGDITSGQQDGAVPLVLPVEKADVLTAPPGNPNAPARIAGDAVSGMPNVTDNWDCPAIPPVTHPIPKGRQT